MNDKTVLNDSKLREFLDFAVESAQLAGQLTLGYFQCGTQHDLKADQSPVTIADRNSELLLRERIETAYPEHGILGEEHDSKEVAGPARWILDPIDGTHSFINGVPLYSVLVGLEWEGRMVVGVIHLPALHETIFAAEGLGCWWDGKRARVSDASDLSQARLVYTSMDLYRKNNRGDAFDRLANACASDRGFCDAYAHALIATGRADVCAEPIMSIWDVAALYPCITEAGGKLTDWQGVDTHKTPEALVTNGKLHEAALALISNSNV